MDIAALKLFLPGQNATEGDCISNVAEAPHDEPRPIRRDSVLGPFQLAPLLHSKPRQVIRLKLCIHRYSTHTPGHSLLDLLGQKTAYDVDFLAECHPSDNLAGAWPGLERETVGGAVVESLAAVAREEAHGGSCHAGVGDVVHLQAFERAAEDDAADYGGRG